MISAQKVIQVHKYLDCQVVAKGEHSFNFRSLLSRHVRSLHVLTILSLFGRVSATYGNDLLPPAQRRIEFSPRREPGVHLSKHVGEADQEFLTALDLFLYSRPN